MSDVTRILQSIEAGDAKPAEELLPLVYDELRKLAAAKMANEQPGQTLSATSLVHEAYLRLVDVEVAQRWENRRHFFAAAAEAMRRILVEAARAAAAQKRGGDLQRIDLSHIRPAALDESTSLLDLDEALSALKERDDEAARLVELRFFAGLKMEDVAAILDISVRKAHYLWDYARVFLRRHIRSV
jgi:RNA polymerase sigma factor (TIGR02999 family)